MGLFSKKKPGTELVNAKKPIDLKRAAIFALCLFILDAFLIGIPCFGIVIAFIIIVGSIIQSLTFLFKDRQRSVPYAIRTAIFIVAIVGIVGMFRFNSYIGQKHADKIVNAVNDYHTATRIYPKDLTQLVPEYLDSVPLASYRLMARDYQYYFASPGRPILHWTFVPPYYGQRIYDFRSMRWEHVD